VCQLHVDPSVASIAAASMVLLTVTVRCLILLVGLLTTLARVSQKDRPDIFREFARAVSAHRIQPTVIPRRRILGERSRLNQLSKPSFSTMNSTWAPRMFPQAGLAFPE
jgi:hypothetical protein